MYRIINIIEKLLTMILAGTYFLGLTAIGSLPMHIIIIVISIFTFFTSLIDMIRIKEINIKYSILNIALILLLLLNIYRPFIDNIIIKDLQLETSIIFNYCTDLIKQNIILITIFMIILFIFNFKLNKKD